MNREEEIRKQAHWLANKFSVRNGYESVEDALMEMAQFVDNNQPSPWISVEDRLPDVGEMVLVNVHHTIDGGGEHHEDDQILVDKFNGTWSCNWCKQRRMGAHLFDMISKTTHWMPIPELKGGNR